jgi:hypothetical protein
MHSVERLLLNIVMSSEFRVRSFKPKYSELRTTYYELLTPEIPNCKF